MTAYALSRERTRCTTFIWFTRTTNCASFGNGVAILRNIETGQEIEQSIRVNLNDGAVRIKPCATLVADRAAAQ